MHAVKGLRQTPRFYICYHDQWIMLGPVPSDVAALKDMLQEFEYILVQEPPARELWS